LPKNQTFDEYYCQTLSYYKDIIELCIKYDNPKKLYKIFGESINAEQKMISLFRKFKNIPKQWQLQLHATLDPFINHSPPELNNHTADKFISIIFLYLFIFICIYLYLKNLI
jgi:hypothetical protein